jgi:hypothetical protein
MHSSLSSDGVASRATATATQCDLLRKQNKTNNERCLLVIPIQASTIPKSISVSELRLATKTLAMSTEQHISIVCCHHFDCTASTPLLLTTNTNTFSTSTPMSDLTLVSMAMGYTILVTFGAIASVAVVGTYVLFLATFFAKDLELDLRSEKDGERARGQHTHLWATIFGFTVPLTVLGYAITLILVYDSTGSVVRGVMRGFIMVGCSCTHLTLWVILGVWLETWSEYWFRRVVGFLVARWR